MWQAAVDATLLSLVKLTNAKQEHSKCCNEADPNETYKDMQNKKTNQKQVRY